MTTYTLVPPTFETGNPRTGRLLSRYKFDYGWGLIVTGATVEQVSTVPSGAWASADDVYLGGHEYDLTAAQAAVLTAAGYGAYITTS